MKRWRNATGPEVLSEPSYVKIHCLKSYTSLAEVRGVGSYIVTDE